MVGGGIAVAPLVRLLLIRMEAFRWVLTLLCAPVVPVAAVFLVWAVLWAVGNAVIGELDNPVSCLLETLTGIADD